MLTVLFATRNRARLLPSVLDAFCALESPSGGWKLVIADNGSTDETGQILTSYTGRLPLRSVFEPKPGKNAALNAGLALLDGDLTILSDDDVFPRSDWLAQMRRAANEHADYSIFGGAIRPRWEAPPPEWTKWVDLGPIFTVTSPSLEEGEIRFENFPVVQGPNMAVRTSVLRSTSFNPSIGPCGTSYPMGSETEFVLRLGRQGHKAWHVREAVVEHFVRAEQLDENWVLQRAIRWGRGRYRMSPDKRLWIGLPRHLFRDMPKELLLLTTARLSKNKPDIFRAQWRLNILRGKAIEARLMAAEMPNVASERTSAG